MDLVITLVGRPNVGKSTLFNVLTQSRDALVADFAGLTRDRQYGRGKLVQDNYWVIDTGGLMDKPEDSVQNLMAEQVQQAIKDANIILFVVDAQDGLTATDVHLAQQLRQANRKIHLVINKIDGLPEVEVISEFASLGLQQSFMIAASQGRGVTQMMSKILADYPAATNPIETTDNTETVAIALIGRPNVGKSTLLNRLLGAVRVVASDQPGTTRDSIYVPFQRANQHYTLIDTAGIRRRGRLNQAIEKFSVLKALQAIAAANVVFLLIDASEGLTDQDMHLLQHALDQGRSLLLLVNKWDGLDTEQRDQVKATLDRRLNGLPLVKICFISALHGTGVKKLLDYALRAQQLACSDLASPKLTRLLEQALIKHPPPLVRGRRIKLRYAHQGGKNPLIIVIHGNQVERIPPHYQRYLANFFQLSLDLIGTPVQIQFKQGENPYAGKRNKLTPRQQYKRKRLLKHVKHGK